MAENNAFTQMIWDDDLKKLVPIDYTSLHFDNNSRKLVGLRTPVDQVKGLSGYTDLSGKPTDKPTYVWTNIETNEPIQYKEGAYYPDGDYLYERSNVEQLANEAWRLYNSNISLSGADRFYKTLNEWKKEHPYLNFALDAIALSPLIPVAAMEAPGAMALLGRTIWGSIAPGTTSGNLIGGLAGAEAGDKAVNLGYNLAEGQGHWWNDGVYNGVTFGGYSNPTVNDIAKTGFSFFNPTYWTSGKALTKAFNAGENLANNTSKMKPISASDINLDFSTGTDIINDMPRTHRAIDAQAMRSFLKQRDITLLIYKKQLYESVKKGDMSLDEANSKIEYINKALLGKNIDDILRSYSWDKRKPILEHVRRNDTDLNNLKWGKSGAYYLDDLTSKTGVGGFVSSRSDGSGLIMILDKNYMNRYPYSMNHEINHMILNKLISKSGSEGLIGKFMDKSLSTFQSKYMSAVPYDLRPAVRRISMHMGVLPKPKEVGSEISAWRLHIVDVLEKKLGRTPRLDEYETYIDKLSDAEIDNLINQFGQTNDYTSKLYHSMTLLPKRDFIIKDLKLLLKGLAFTTTGAAVISNQSNN